MSNRNDQERLRRLADAAANEPDDMYCSAGGIPDELRKIRARKFAALKKMKRISIWCRLGIHKWRARYKSPERVEGYFCTRCNKRKIK